jgi:hypothetical protein
MSDTNVIEEAEVEIDVPENEIEAIYEDERSAVIYDQVFNPEDNSYDAERDQERLDGCIEDLVRNGHSRAAARLYMEEQLSECEDTDDAPFDSNF